MTRENFDMQIQIVLQDLADNCNSRYCSEAQKDHEIATAYESMQKLIETQYPNRTCGSCRSQKDGFCYNTIVELMNSEKLLVADGFGCNKWKSKDE